MQERARKAKCSRASPAIGSATTPFWRYSPPDAPRPLRGGIWGLPSKVDKPHASLDAFRTGIRGSDSPSLSTSRPSDNVRRSCLFVLAPLSMPARGPRQEVSYFRKAAHGQQIRNRSDCLRTVKPIKSSTSTHATSRKNPESCSPYATHPATSMCACVRTGRATTVSLTLAASPCYSLPACAGIG